MNYTFSSLTRISDLAERAFHIESIDRSHWETGDYVLGEVVRNGSKRMKLELPNGRLIEPLKGQQIIGAFGVRYATLEATGTWKSIGEDGIMHLLTGAGLLAKLDSISFLIPSIVKLQYKGHVMRASEKVRMSDFSDPVLLSMFDIPVIVIFGTSMTAGKTHAARMIIHELTRKGYKVVGAKLTGAGRYKDILAMKDAGAIAVYDFVDAGLPSTVCAPGFYKPALESILDKMALSGANLAVIEIGASPLEPYNGLTAMQRLHPFIKMRVLAASDPYAVFGVMKSFGVVPDVAVGVATSTVAGIELIERLCKIQALNLMNPNSISHLNQILAKKFKNLERQ